MYLYIYSQARSIVFKSRGGGRLVQKILTNKKKSKQISQNNKNHNPVGGVGWGVGVSVVHLILELHCSFFHFYFNFSFGLKKVGEGVNSLIIHLFIFELKKSLWCDKKCKNAANPPPLRPPWCYVPDSKLRIWCRGPDTLSHGFAVVQCFDTYVIRSLLGFWVFFSLVCSEATKLNFKKLRSR